MIKSNKKEVYLSDVHYNLNLTNILLIFWLNLPTKVIFTESKDYDVCKDYFL